MPPMRLLHGLRPWSMAEVCLLGALVSIVVFGLSGGGSCAGIWAMAALSILLPLIASRDTHQLWYRVSGDAPCP